MGKPKAPSAPDPYRVAGADFAFNNLSQYTPYGNLVITPPRFGRNNQLLAPGAAELELSPELQGIFDRQLDISGNTLDEALRRQAEFSQFPDVPSTLDFSRVRDLPTDFSADRSAVENAVFQRARGLLAPVFEEQERALRTTLADQGLPAGSEARNYDLGQFYDAQNRAYQDAALQAVLAGGAEQSRLFDLTNTARQSDIADQLQGINVASTDRARRFNELAALLGQQQVAMPNLQNFYAPRGTDFTGAQALATNAQQQAYQTQAGMFGDLLGALGQLGSSAIRASDIRLKEDIRRVGQTDSGVPLYTYRYKGMPLIQLGVMAQELERTQPEAVIDVGGVKFVDYERVH